MHNGKALARVGAVNLPVNAQAVKVELIALIRKDRNLGLHCLSQHGITLQRTAKSDLAYDLKVEVADETLEAVDFVVGAPSGRWSR